MRKGLLLLTLAGLAARVAFLALEPKVELLGDESSWVALGVHGLAELRHPLNPLARHIIFYPPGYPYFIAVPYLLFGSLTAVRWVQAILGAALVPVTGLIGARAFSPRVGLVAAVLTAFYPELIWFAAHFWSETLFMVLLWWAIERAMAADESERVAPALAGGVLCGLAALTRETALPVAPLAALWLAWPGRTAAARARGTAFLLAAILTVLPWTARNWIVFHAFVPVSTFGPLNLWQGNARLDRDDLYRQSDSVLGPIAQYRLAWREAEKAISARQPFWIFEKTREELPAFFEAWSEALTHVEGGAYGLVSPGTERLMKLVVLAPYVLVVAVGVPALGLFPWTRARVLLGLLLAYYLAIHIITYGAHRFHVPMLPVLFVWSAAVFAGRTDVWSIASPSRKLLALGLLLLMALSLAQSLVLGQPTPH
jgi:hypothetical protein